MGFYHITHGNSRHPLYKIWAGIKNRCFNKNEPAYKKYGAVGITVCDEWANDFTCFYEWAISNGWKEGLSIDRYPNQKGNYEPTNCRCTDAKGQSNNRSSNKIVEYKGQKLTLIQACEKANVNYKNTWKRMNVNNISFEESLKYVNRYKSGSDINTSKLSKEQVEEIRRLYIPRKFPTRKLAKMFNVSQAAIFYIIKGKNWNNK